jgi:hypothetical protein
VGDWAVVLRSPTGSLAARVTAFDPVAPYTAQLFREAALVAADADLGL